MPIFSGFFLGFFSNYSVICGGYKRFVCFLFLCWVILRFVVCFDQRFFFCSFFFNYYYYFFFFLFILRTLSNVKTKQKKKKKKIISIKKKKKQSVELTSVICFLSKKEAQFILGWPYGKPTRLQTLTRTEILPPL